MQSFGHPFNILTSVDSTNNYAMQMAHARMAKHGSAWFTLQQTNGKGQRGKVWKTNPGENIALSIVIEPTTLSPAKPFLLTAAVALGAFDFVKKYLGPETSIKWPNDIYWRDRKAGGILIESIVRGNRWTFAVAGIGLNINQQSFESSLSRAVSFWQVTNQTHDIILLARELCSAIEHRYIQLISGEETQLLEDYNLALFCRQQPAKLKIADKLEEVTIYKTDADGRLCVHLKNGEALLCNWGEVEWIFSDL